MPTFLEMIKVAPKKSILQSAALKRVFDLDYVCSFHKYTALSWNVINYVEKGGTNTVYLHGNCPTCSCQCPASINVIYDDFGEELKFQFVSSGEFGGGDCHLTVRPKS